MKIELTLKRDQELTAGTGTIVSARTIEGRILLIGGHKVILDADLADLYGVEAKALTRAVRRNPERFPGDFMLQLSSQEFANLRRQYGTSSQWGGRRYPPFAFTAGGADIAFDVCAFRPSDINCPHATSEAFLRSESSPLPDRQHLLKGPHL